MKNPVHEAKETAPPSTKQKASLLSTLRSLSNNNHNNSCSHRLLSNNSLSMSPTSPLLSASSSVSSPLAVPRPHTRFLSREAPPPWPASFSRPTPLLGVPPLSLPIGRADTPSARQRDRWAFPPLSWRTLRLTCFASSVGVFGGKPRRFSILLAGVVSTWYRGYGGVVASLKGVAWRERGV